MLLDPADEARHQPDDLSAWSEAWDLFFWADDLSLGGYARVALLPAARRSWYWACVVGRDRPLVTVIEPDAPMPRPPGLELRTSGLWADTIWQTPYQHMTVGLEAFGVGMEDPTEVFARGWGDQVPMGFDLEWESDAAAVTGDATGYELACEVHGEVLLGHEEIDFTGWGHRGHRWGAMDWAEGWTWFAARLEDGSCLHGSDREGIAVVGGSAFEPAVAVDTSGDGLWERARLRLGDHYVAVTPIAWAPVAVAADSGSAVRVARALATFTLADGRTGTGWLEHVH